MNSKKKSWLVTADREELKILGVIVSIPIMIVLGISLKLLTQYHIFPERAVALGIIMAIPFALFILPMSALPFAQTIAIRNYKKTLAYKIETLLHGLHTFSTKNVELKKSIHSIVEFSNFLIEYANNHDLASDSFEKIIHLHLQMAFEALSLYQTIAHSPLRTGNEEQDVLIRLENVKTALQERAKGIISDAELSLNASISAFNEVSKIR